MKGFVFIIWQVFLCTLSQQNFIAAQNLSRGGQQDIVKQSIGPRPQENPVEKHLSDRIKHAGLKEANVESVLLDSIYAYNYNSPTDSVLTEKIYVNYNWDDRKVIQFNEKLDATSNQWIPGYQNEYFYDDRGNIDLEIDSEWNKGLKKYVPVSKDEYEFDDLGHKTVEAFYYWSESLGKWVGTAKTERNYDWQGDQTVIAYYFWGTDSGKWEGSSKKEFGYDDSRRQNMIAYYTWNSDSGDWKGTSRFDYLYDENGFQTKSITYTWDEASSGGWKESTMDEMSYYKNDSIATYTFYDWSEPKTKWQEVDRYEYTYTDTSKIAVGLTWIEGQGWGRDTRKESYYDHRGLVILEINFLWIESMEDWIVWKKSETTYDENRGLIYLVSSELNVETFMLEETFKMRAEIQYDENNRQVFYESAYWEAGQGVWINDYHSEKSYTNDGMLTYSVSSYWNIEKEKWIGDKKYEAEYDERGYQTYEVSYTWSEEKNLWVGSSRKETSFDSFGNEISRINYAWVDSNSVWVKDYKNEHYFNENQEETKVIYYNWDLDNEKWVVTYSSQVKKTEDVYDASDNQTLMIIRAWNESTKEWTVIQKYYYYNSVYQQYPVGVATPKKYSNIPLVFPNPANDYVHVLIESPAKGLLNIYNDQGQKVKTIVLVGENTTVVLSDLRAGLYIFKIQLGNLITSSKVVLK